MRFFPAKFFPEGIAGRMSVILLASLALAFTILSISYYFETRLISPPVALFMERQVGTAMTLNVMDRMRQEKLLKAIRQNNPQIVITIVEEVPDDIDWTNIHSHFPEVLPLPDKAEARLGHLQQTLPENRSRVTVYIRLKDGSWLRTQANLPTMMFVPGIFPEALFLLSFFSAILLLWSSWKLIKPLRRLADAAEKIDPSSHQPLNLEEQGPLEIRKVSRALNRLQGRISSLITDRTHMLAAVGHDLRTPVTRIRLRVETLDDETIKQSLLADVGMMERLLQRLLHYFRHGNTGERTISINLNSLLDSVINRWRDDGFDVQTGTFNPCNIRGRPDELMHMFDNLIDNALKYAGKCEVSLDRQKDWIIVQIIDQGPGIPSDQREKLLQAFTRGDEARNMDEATGFGLGLAICSESARNHNARLTLTGTDPHGLTVKLAFPVLGPDL